MFRNNKILKHSLHSNVPYKPSTAHALHSFCLQDLIRHVQLQLHWSLAQHNSPSMHINMHYTSSTAHPIASTLLYAQLTQGIADWQNGTRCRNAMKVLWYYSHLVWLVFKCSIPTCTCFHSENVFVTFLIIICLGLPQKPSKTTDRLSQCIDDGGGGGWTSSKKPRKKFHS